MDNMARFYQFRIDQAAKLIKRGQRFKALDILWKLRLEPDLGLYCRAFVNLILATEVDLDEHPDAPKFAHECLRLLVQMRRDGLVEDPETEQEVVRLRNHAQQTLIAIEDEMSAIDTHKREQLAASGSEEVDRNHDSKAAAEEERKRNKEGIVLADAGELEPWTLEGAYSDDYALSTNPPRSPSLPAIFGDLGVEEQSALPTPPATSDAL